MSSKMSSGSHLTLSLRIGHFRSSNTSIDTVWFAPNSDLLNFLKWWHPLHVITVREWQTFSKWLLKPSLTKTLIKAEVCFRFGKLANLLCQVIKDYRRDNLLWRQLLSIALRSPCLYSYKNVNLLTRQSNRLTDTYSLKMSRSFFQQTL